MTTTPKRIIYDESGQPTEAVVNYADWRRIGAQLDPELHDPVEWPTLTRSADAYSPKVSFEEFERLAEELRGTWSGVDELEFQRALKAEQDEIARYDRLFQDVPLIPIEPPIGRWADSLRREFGLQLPDFQAAVALGYGLILATRNTKDFTPARHPFVTVPYTLPHAPPLPAPPAGP